MRLACGINSTALALAPIFGTREAVGEGSMMMDQGSSCGWLVAS